MKYKSALSASFNTQWAKLPRGGLELVKAGKKTIVSIPNGLSCHKTAVQKVMIKSYKIMF